MSHFECRLNRRFWRSKKVVQVVQTGEGVIWTKSTRTAAFYRETFPKTHTQSIAIFQYEAIFGMVTTNTQQPKLILEQARS